MVAGVVGVLLGPVLGTLARAVGPELPFASIAVIGVVLMVCALRMPAPAVGAGALVAGARVREALRSRQVRGGMAFVLLPALTFGAMNVLAPLELDRLGTSGLLVGAVVGAVAGSGIADVASEAVTWLVLAGLLGFASAGAALARRAPVAVA